MQRVLNGSISLLEGSPGDFKAQFKSAYFKQRNRKITANYYC